MTSFYMRTLAINGLRWKLERPIMWWQLGCNDKWTPEFTDRFGWTIKIKSIYEELLVCICVGSFIIWENPFEEVNENKFVHPVLLMPLGHREEDLALKSPVITHKDGLRLLMSLKSFLKLDKNKSNSLLFWLGAQ